MAGMRCSAIVLALCLPVALAACGDGTPTAAIPLPSYGIGDTYGFDDGSVQTVVGTEGDDVYWRDDKASLVTTRDVLLPPLETRSPGGTIRRQLSTAGLFPLTPDKRVTFTVMEEAPRGAQETGDCAVGGQVRAVTPVGSFETVRVTCAIRGAGGGTVVHRTYFYAPSIGYYVRRDEWTGDGPPHSIRLVRYVAGAPVLSDAALRQRTTAIQQALENDVSDLTMAWRDPSSEANGTIEPVLTEHSPDSGWCREFREQIQVAQRHYDLLGTACRAQGGTWLVKEITPFRAASLAH